VLNEVMHNTL